MSMKIWAVVPAAGTGARFGAGIPKQYQLLGEKTIIERTLSVLLKSNLFAGVVVALAEDDQYFDGLAVSQDKKIIKAVGGADRATSVRNALRALKQKSSSNDLVMVHDAARPLLSQSSLVELSHVANELPENTGAILAVRVADTLKLERSADAKSSTGAKVSQASQLSQLSQVDKTVSRKGYWAAQTPQMFAVDNLLNALDELIEQGRQNQITDEASAMELIGHTVWLVEGQSSNIKITRPDDLQLAEAYLLSEKSNEKSSEKTSQEIGKEIGKESSK